MFWKVLLLRPIFLDFSQYRFYIRIPQIYMKIKMSVSFRVSLTVELVIVMTSILVFIYNRVFRFTNNSDHFSSTHRFVRYNSGLLLQKRSNISKKGSTYWSFSQLCKYSIYLGIIIYYFCIFLFSVVTQRETLDSHISL